MPDSKILSTVASRARAAKAQIDLAFALALVAAVLAPLIVNPWGYHPFELPKAVLVRSLGLVTMAVVVATPVRGYRNELRRSLLFWPTVLLGLAFLLAMIFSYSPQVSFWGSYERQQGLLNLAALLALFLAASLSLRAFVRIEILWNAIVWTSAPVVTYAFLQAAGIDFWVWSTDAASAVLSTLGRSNFLGSYLVLVMPLTAGRLLLSKRRWLYAVLLASQMICLALTQARGGWLGAMVAGLAFGLLWAAFRRNGKLVLAMLVLAGVALGFVALLSVPVGPFAELAKLPGLDRLASLGDFSAGSSAARLTIWRSTLPLIARRPWLGYGPDTMRLVFAGTFPPQLVYYQGRNVVVDRAHNLWLDLAMDSGLVGVLAFSALLLGFARLCWQGLRRPDAGAHRVAWISFAAAVAGHLADMQVSFDTAATAVVFWLVLAIGVGLSRVEATSGGVPAEAVDISGQGVPIVVRVASMVLAILVGLVGVRPLLADSAVYRSQDGRIALAQRRAAALQAVRLWPYEPTYRLGLAMLEEQTGDFEAAERQLVAAISFTPADPRLWTARGDLYARWALVEPNRLERARSAYQVALRLSPNTAVYHTAMGMILAQGGQMEAAETELTRAIALDATDGMAYRYLAQFYLAIGRTADAERALQQAEIWSERTAVPARRIDVRQD